MTLQDDTDKLRAGGFNSGEIQHWTAQRSGQLINAGFSQSEVMDYMGKKEPDMSGVQQVVNDNLQASKPLSFDDAVKAGWQGSATGLMVRGKMPDTQMTGSEPWYSRDASMVAQTVADLPWMGVGAAAGAAAGLESGPGAAVTGMAGAFTLPTALRSTLVDSYTKGEFQNFRDFWDRTSGIVLSSAKSYVTGALTALSGGTAASGAAALGAGAVAQSTASLAAQIATMTTAGKAMEGQVPSAQDFMDSAIVMGGLHTVSTVVPKLQSIYTKTGVTPSQIIADAKADPTIMQDVAAHNVDVPKAYEAAVDPVFRPKPTEAVETAKPVEQSPSAEPASEPQKPDASASAPAAPVAPEADTPESRILSKIQVGGEDAADKPYSWNDFYTSVVDKLDPIRRATDAMQGDGEDAYKAMRLLPGSVGKAEQFIQNSPFKFDTLENTGKSLKDIIDPVKDDLNGLRAYSVASRALELEKRGINSGFDPDDAKAVVKAGKAKFEPVANELRGYQDNVLSYLKDAGVLTDKGMKEMRAANQSYVPFYRVMDEDNQGFGVGSKIRNPINGIKGSDRDVIDPLESIVRNTYSYIALADKNAAVKSFYDMARKEADPSQYFETPKTKFQPTTVTDKELESFLDKNGLRGTQAGGTGPEQMPSEGMTIFRAMRTPLAKDQIGFFDKGEYKVLTVDPDLAEAFNGTPRPAHGLLFSMLRAPAALFRAGITTPEFIIRHLLRNQIAASTIAEKGNIPFYDTFKGMISYLGKDEDYQKFLKSGGFIQAATALDRSDVQDVMRKLTGEDPAANFTDKAWNLVRTPLDAMHAIQQTLETSTRLGAFQRAMKNQQDTAENIKAAGFASRNIAPDPARIGKDTASWNAITALFNMEIQHTDQTIEALRNRPIPTLAKLFAGITLPSVMLWAANRNTDEWKEAHQWERDMFWMVPVNGVTLRIPKPFLLGALFGSGVERLLDKISGADSDNRGLKNFAHDLGEWAAPNFIPIAVRAPLEQLTNYSFFRGGPLVPDRLNKLLPEYRYTEYTSELTKAIGHIVGTVPYLKDTSAASPIVINNYINNWTGGAGVYALQIADLALRKTGVLPDPPLPTSTLADIPIIKGFVVRYPSATADSIEEFRDDYQERAMTYATVQALAKQGDADAAVAVMQTNPAAMAKLDGIEKALGEQTQLVRLLYKNPDIKPDEKRQLIDATYFNMIEMSKAGNVMMKAIDGSSAAKP